MSKLEPVFDDMQSETGEGRITLYDAKAFAGMHKAGQLAARALDMIVEHVRPGVTTEALDELIMDFAQRARCHSGDAELSRVHKGHLHVG